jgi:alpha-N-acetylglucosaminidase
LKYCQDNPALNIDWYAMEEPWTLAHNRYGVAPAGNPVDIAKEVYQKAFE